MKTDSFHSAPPQRALSLFLPPSLSLSLFLFLLLSLTTTLLAIRKYGPIQAGITNTKKIVPQRLLHSVILGLFNLDLLYLLDPEALLETGEKCQHSFIFARL